ncbi:unnamed protein product [Nezara viridula]|uniref:Uncharacterized protein n=1 Tax=Nezara viridula TaxID=85310 RepID=A0A9P0DZA3_NEZVI|nr:unnamed protein product [Nezara viridula]
MQLISHWQCSQFPACVLRNLDDILSSGRWINLPTLRLTMVPKTIAADLLEEDARWPRTSWELWGHRTLEPVTLRHFRNCLEQRPHQLAFGPCLSWLVISGFGLVST